MRRRLFPILAATVAMLAAPMAAHAQRGGDDSADSDAAAKKKKSADEWGDKQAPLPSMRNAGPCPYVKVLYDASRYVELEGGKAASSAVGYTGEIQGLSSGCAYAGGDPIQMKIEILFALGKGPQAKDQQKAYTYWVAVTDRNRGVIAKEFFTLPANFPAGQDRVLMTDTLNSITIPRAAPTVSGSNFEILVGFDVTPEMAEFTREGKRFRVNAGTAATQ